jgi:hypothetical protein
LKIRTSDWTVGRIEGGRTLRATSASSIPIEVGGMIQHAR